MDVYKTEDEQVEAIRKWWQENGKSIILGVVVGLGAVFGWRTWQEHQIARAEAASGLYQDVLKSLRADNADEAKTPATEIVSSYGNTGYAVLARLVLAKLAVGADDTTAAADHLRKALEQNSEATLDLAIRLRLARVLTAREQYDEALAMLKVNDRGEYGPSYDELRGDILALQGDKQAAYESYQKALTAGRARSTDTSVLEMKMNDLGVGSSG